MSTELSSEQATQELYHRLAYPNNHPHEILIPVYLPGGGGERQVMGQAKVHCDGKIEIQIDPNYQTELLHHLIHSGSLLHLSFGYIAAQPAHKPFT